MFDFIKENPDLEQIKAKRMAEKMFSRMMSQSILESENAPEYMKLSVLLMDKSEDVTNAIHEMVVRNVSPTLKNEKLNEENLKKILEYLSLVEVGIKQFIETEGV